MPGRSADNCYRYRCDGCHEVFYYDRPSVSRGWHSRCLCGGEVELEAWCDPPSLRDVLAENARLRRELDELMRLVSAREAEAEAAFAQTEQLLTRRPT
jgi:hypothetical protein